MNLILREAVVEDIKAFTKLNREEMGYTGNRLQRNFNKAL